MSDTMTRQNGFFGTMSRYSLCVCIVVLVVVTSIKDPSFYSASNVVNIMRQFGPLSFVSLGMTFVILAGYLDLSISGTFSLVMVVTVRLIDQVGPLSALFAGLLVGLLCGVINGLVIQTVKASRKSEALFITYGIGLMYSAIALLYCNGETKRLTSGHRLYEMLGSGMLGSFSYSFLIFLLCLAALYFFQSKTYMGRSVFLAGGNPLAAELAGVPVKRVPVLTFALSGLLAGFGSIILLSRVTTASPVSGMGFDTNSIISVLIGGTSLAGGKGSVLRTAVGVLMLTLLSNCCNILGVSSYAQNVVRGVILIVAIWLDSRSMQQGA